MRRREFITLLGGAAAALLCGPSPLRAQLSRVPTIGLLTNSSVTRSAENLGELVHGLQDLGYVEGRQIKIIPLFSEGRSDTLPTLAAQLVRLEVDVIVAAPTQAVRAAQQATRTIPIVMANTSDPVRLGFVQSLANPGGNITGLSNQAADLGPKQLQLLKELIPTVKQVAILVNPRNPSHERWADYQNPAAQLGMGLEAIEATSDSALDGVDGAFATIERRRPDALLVFGDGVFLNQRARIAQWAAAIRLATMYVFREHVDAGGLMSYGPSARANYRRAATYVDKILKGAKPSDLPVEQPTKFDLVINLKTAKTLGLEIPPMLLARADEVIE
jgi:putative ABC transport system substrate-binding protein